MRRLLKSGTRRQRWVSRLSVDIEEADDIIERLAGFDSDFPQVFTISCFCKPRGTNTNRYLFAFGDGTLNNAFYVSRNGDLTPPRYRGYIKIGGVEVSSISDAWNITGWDHVCVTRDATGLTSFYLNGVLLFSGVCAGTLAHSRAGIGCYQTGAAA